MSWSKTPPSAESGWYWMRRNGEEPTIAWCSLPWTTQDGREFDGRCHPRNSSLQFKNAIRSGWEWWPTPISPPRSGAEGSQ